MMFIVLVLLQITTIQINSSPIDDEIKNIFDYSNVRGYGRYKRPNFQSKDDEITYEYEENPPEETVNSDSMIRGDFPSQQDFNCVHGFCNSTNSYDDERIKETIIRDKQFMAMYGEVFDVQIPFIASRFGDESNRMNMCETKTVLVTPRRAVDIYGSEQLIVNVDQYRQILTVETCLNELNECVASRYYLPSGMRSYCETQYAIIRLVVFTKEEKLDMARFRIPTGCFCSYNYEHKKIIVDN